MLEFVLNSSVIGAFDGLVLGPFVGLTECEEEGLWLGLAVTCESDGASVTGGDVGEMECSGDGLSVTGESDGDTEGLLLVGLSEGSIGLVEGMSVEGDTDGESEGDGLGASVIGAFEGPVVGFTLGSSLGDFVGFKLGSSVGAFVSASLQSSSFPFISHNAAYLSRVQLSAL